MLSRLQTNNARLRALMGGALAIVLCLSPTIGSAQERDREQERYRDQQRYRERDSIRRVDAGTVISVRTNQTIDVDRRDDRVYTGIVDRDVRSEGGRVAIPRGSNVELVVRVARDNDLILDLDSVVVNGERYRVTSDPNRVESRGPDNLVGAIVGAIAGGQARGRSVRIPRDSIVTFRLERPLDVGEGYRER